MAKLELRYNGLMNPSKSSIFKTEGRNDTWKNNVLTNKATGKIKIPLTVKGKQNLKVYWLDSVLI